MFEKGLAAYLRTLDALRLEIAFDDHLGRDSGMVGADHPERVLAAHPLAAGEHVLKRIVERVADVERAGDVGRRHDNRPRSCVGAIRTEQALGLPMGVPALLDRLWFERLGTPR